MTTSDGVVLNVMKFEDEVVVDINKEGYKLTKNVNKSTIETCGDQKMLISFLLLMTISNPKDKLLVHGCDFKTGDIVRVFSKKSY